MEINRQANSSVTTPDASFPRYPFNGKSLYLIDKIMLIGYLPNKLPLLITSSLAQCKDKDNEEFTLQEKPIILNSISSDYTKICLENDDIIEQIFPDNPLIYYQTDQEDKTFPSPTSIIFSFNVPYENDSKTSLNYYTYISYDRITIKTIKEQTYYYPQAICFLSNYPYFMNYHHLAQFIMTLTSLPAPLEFYLYNLVHLPSPINASYTLRYYPLSSKNHNEPLLFKQLSGYPLLQINLSELFNIFKVEDIIKIFIFTFLEIDIFFFFESLELLNMIMFIFSNLNYPCNDSTYFMHVVSVSSSAFDNGRNTYVTKTFSSMLGINSPYGEVLSKTQKEDFLIVDVSINKVEYIHKENISDTKNVEDNVALLRYIELIIKEKTEKPLGFFGKAVRNLYEKLMTKSTKETMFNNKRMDFNPDFLKAPKEKDISTLDQVNRSIQEQFYCFILEILGYLSTLNKLEYPNQKTKKYHISYDKTDTNNSLSKEEMIFISKLKDCFKYNTYVDNFIQHNDSIDLFKIPLLFAEEFIHENKCQMDTMIKNQQKTKGNNHLDQKFNLFDTIDSLYGIDPIVTVKLDLDCYFDLRNAENKTNSLNDSLNMLDLVGYWQKHLSNAGKTSKKTRMLQENYFKYYYYEINNKDENRVTTASPSYSLITREKLEFIGETTGIIFAKIQTNYYDLKANKSDKNINLSSTDKNAIINESTDKEKAYRFNDYLEKLKRHMNVNDVIGVNSTMIQEHVEKSLMNQKKLFTKDIVFSCYIMLYAVSRQFNRREALSDMEKIITILKAKTHLYSFRKYVAMLIILYTNLLIDSKDCRIEEQCLKLLIALFKEEKCLPNEELMHWLNISIPLMSDSYPYEKEEETMKSLKMVEGFNDSIEGALTKQRKKIVYKNLDVPIPKKEQKLSDVLREDYGFEYLSSNVLVSDVMKIADNVSYDGMLFDLSLSQSSCTSKVESGTIHEVPILFLNHDDKGYGEDLYSPLWVYNKLVGLVNKNRKDFGLFSESEKKDLITICANILFYIGGESIMIYEDWKKIPINFIFEVLKIVD